MHHLKAWATVARRALIMESDRAAEPPTTRRIARHFARARRREVRRGLVLCEIRRHPRACDGNAGGPAAALAQRTVARLDHRRIRHAAARHLGTNAPRSV